MVIVRASYCPQNHPCPMVRRCPNNALEQRGFEAPTVIAERCLDCGDCTSFCRVFRSAA